MTQPGCVDAETFAKLKAAAGGDLVHQLLGCTWGHTLGSKDDKTPCMEPAAQIVALHPHGGEAAIHVKLCGEHVEVVKALTTEHGA